MKRQGDLLFTAIDSIPTGAKRLSDGVIVRGEATGHAHRLIGGEVFIKDNILFLQIANKGTVVHEEHKPIV